MQMAWQHAKRTSSTFLTAFTGRHLPHVNDIGVYRRLIPKNRQRPHVRVIALREERAHSLHNRGVFFPWTHGFVLDESLRHHEKQVVSDWAHVALPEIQEVHIVNGCFASLNFNQDAGIAKWLVVVRAQSCSGIIAEETLRFTPKSQ